MAEITIDRMCCKGCDICIAICPRKIFVRSKKRNGVVCRMCERMCPDGAINVEQGDVSNED